jgi:hypothetical protein
MRTAATCSAGGGIGARTRAPSRAFATRRAVLTAQSNGVGDVDAAAARLVKLIGRECRAHCRIAILDRAPPKAQI